MANILYSDFDISFDLDESTGDIKKLVNRDSIRNSLFRIIQLNKYDIPFDVASHTKLKELLFEIPSHTTDAAIITNLTWLCEELEPRIKVEEMTANYNEEDDSYTITIHYNIKRLNIKDTLTKDIKRVR